MASQHVYKPPEGLTVEAVNNMTLRRLKVTAQHFEPPIPTDQCKSKELLQERLRYAYNHYHGIAMDTQQVGFRNSH